MSELHGQWFDGRASRPQSVRLACPSPGTLQLLTADGARHEWPVSEIELNARLGSTPRLLRRPGHGHVECPDSPLLDAWLPGRSSRVEDLADWFERRRAAIVAAAAATVVATVAFVQFGLPATARFAAERMPRTVEVHASSQVVELLERTEFAPSRLSAERRERLHKRFRALVAGEPRAPELTLSFVDAPAMGPNAFALPDGRIFMTDELVALAESDEEVLAVLAHEAGHHVHHHGMRQALESSGVFVLAGLLLGDASGSSLAVSIPATLLSNGFSRGHEREADAYAFALLDRRGLSPRSFATVMGRLAKASPAGSDEVIGYLSTHPPTPERIAAAESAARRRAAKD
ncbi:M48 family metallopeptidase [Lysobacter korlensis]|uniref:M48 family metallopeptidase n=1 Tax=Lysobacter korlensis TaxID=553636 RepID=A0ABV6RQ47_9GAMM